MTHRAPLPGGSSGRPAPNDDTLLDLDAWLRRTAEARCGAFGYTNATLQQVRSAWTVIRTELHVPLDTPIEQLRPDDLMDRFAAERPSFRSGQTYRTRLRLGLRLYTAARHGAAPDTASLRTRLPARRATAPDQQSGGQSAVTTVRFPLRGDLIIDLQCPHDLQASEADRIAVFLHSLVIT